MSEKWSGIQGYLNVWPTDNRTYLPHFNTKLLWYLDSHCITFVPTRVKENQDFLPFMILHYCQIYILYNVALPPILKLQKIIFFHIQFNPCSLNYILQWDLKSGHSKSKNIWNLDFLKIGFKVGQFSKGWAIGRHFCLYFWITIPGQVIRRSLI